MWQILMNPGRAAEGQRLLYIGLNIHTQFKEVQRDSESTEWSDMIVPDCSDELLVSHV